VEYACKQCGSISFVKNGFVRKLQRYRCKKCGYNFTATPKRGRSIGIKALAVWLYKSGKISFRKLGKLLGVSAVSAYKWVRQESEALPESEIWQETREMGMDEVCRFLYEKKTSIGFENPILVTHAMVSPELWVAVIMGKRRSCPICTGYTDDGAVYPGVMLPGQQVVSKQGTLILDIITLACAVN
jgi:transposase-like protein